MYDDDEAVTSQEMTARPAVKDDESVDVKKTDPSDISHRPLEQRPIHGLCARGKRRRHMETSHR